MRSSSDEQPVFSIRVFRPGNILHTSSAPRSMGIFPSQTPHSGF